MVGGERRSPPWSGSEGEARWSNAAGSVEPLLGRARRFRGGWAAGAENMEGLLPNRRNPRASLRADPADRRPSNPKTSSRHGELSPGRADRSRPPTRSREFAACPSMLTMPASSTGRCDLVPRSGGDPSPCFARLGRRTRRKCLGPGRSLGCQNGRARLGIRIEIVASRQKTGQRELARITATLKARFAGGIPMDGTIPRIPRKDRRRMEKRCGKC